MISNFAVYTVLLQIPAFDPTGIIVLVVIFFGGFALFAVLGIWGMFALAKRNRTYDPGDQRRTREKSRRISGR